MACGCNKRKSSARTQLPGNLRSLSTTTGNTTPTQVRAQSLTPNVPKSDSNAAKRKIQALRRESILRNLGK